MTGRPDISMQMNIEGTRIWRNLTRRNISKPIAIVLDNKVYSAPVVNTEITNGQSSISGNFTIEEAQDLANILKIGKLPAPTKIIEETVIGPSLGLESQNQGIISIIVGLVLVLLFMIFYYAKAGMIANVALSINVLFILGTMAQLNAALTLPGIAGIVLTIGMSIDANVLIFERVREELSIKGANLLNAVQKGYNRALGTILDSNITTMLTAIFLYFFGSGPIKGFAITLIIGIIYSFFSSVYITRVIVFHLTRKKGNSSKLSFYTPFTKNLLQKMNFDFLDKRKLAYICSSIIIIIGIIIMISRGLYLGVDFKGGRSYIVAFKKSIPAF